VVEKQYHQLYSCKWRGLDVRKTIESFMFTIQIFLQMEREVLLGHFTNILVHSTSTTLRSMAMALALLAQLQPEKPMVAST
jgi:hypothetical protein